MYTYKSATRMAPRLNDYDLNPGRGIGRPAVSGTVIHSTSLTGIVVPPVLFGVRGRVRALIAGTRPGV
jgi:hypothetical protein